MYLEKSYLECVKKQKKTTKLHKMTSVISDGRNDTYNEK